MQTPRHPGDAKDLGFIARPPDGAPPQRVRDVLLVPTSDSGEPSDYRTFPPAGDPAVDLGRDLVLTEFDQGDAELMMNACAPRGHYFFAVRQFGTRYAFVREIDLASHEEHPYVWDPEG